MVFVYLGQYSKHMFMYCIFNWFLIGGNNWGESAKIIKIWNSSIKTVPLTVLSRIPDHHLRVRSAAVVVESLNLNFIRHKSGRSGHCERGVVGHILWQPVFACVPLSPLDFVFQSRSVGLESVKLLRRKNGLWVRVSRPAHSVYNIKPVERAYCPGDDEVARSCSYSLNIGWIFIRSCRRRNQG